VIACVTGGTGIIGRRIVKGLRNRGYEVRILTRQVPTEGGNTGVTFFNGCLEQRDSLVPFLKGCKLLFHCAGEKTDPSKMMTVNVQGTTHILSLLEESHVEYFCYISSAGVVGKAVHPWVDESTPCHPLNIYEESKKAAEELVCRGIPGCKTVILRPTNVIDDDNPGALNMPLRASLADYLMVFLKGGERAHIVHAEDVAQAALYFITRSTESPECFFVSCDHEEFNTFSGLWALYKAIRQDKSIEGLRPLSHLPIIVPYVLRRIRLGSCNYGNVRYSSAKLLSTGFRYHLGVEGAVRHIVASRFHDNS
jgi:nucleoside-diphosphate-sugar epimerase